jgi:hypothetical protein
VTVTLLDKQTTSHAAHQTYVKLKLMTGESCNFDHTVSNEKIRKANIKEIKNIYVI